MKTLLLISTLIMTSCIGGSDSGESSSDLIPSPIKTPGQQINEISSNPTENNKVNDTEEDLNQIISELESEQEDLEKVSRVLESEDIDESLNVVPDFIAQFDIQNSAFYNINEIPIFYVFGYHRIDNKRKGFDVVKVANFGEQQTHYKGTKENHFGRINSVYHNDDLPIFITNRPINLLTIDKNKVSHKIDFFPNGLENLTGNIVAKNKLHFKKIIKNNKNICGFIKLDGLIAFKVNTETNELIYTPRIQQWPNDGKLGDVVCNEQSLEFVLNKENKKDLFSYNFSNHQITQIKTLNEKNSRLRLYFRDNSKFLQEYLPKTESRIKKIYNHYSYNNDFSMTKVIKIPSAKPNPYRHLKIYKSSENATTNKPELDILISDKHQRILTDDILFSVRKLPTYQPRVRGFKTIRNELIVLSNNKDIHHFNYKTNKFEKLGNPLDYHVHAISEYNDKFYITTDRNSLLEWDPSKDWTYKKIPYVKLKREDESQNPKFIKTFKDIGIIRILNTFTHSSGLTFYAQLDDKKTQRLFNYSVTDNLIHNETFDTSTSFNLRSIQEDGSNFIFGTRYSGPRNDFTSDQSAKLIWLNRDNLTLVDEVIPVPDKKDIHSIVKTKHSITFISHNSVYSMRKNETEARVLLNFGGVNYKKIVLTPNNKLITISNGNIILLNPEDMSTKVLFEISKDQINKIRNFALFEDVLFLIDKNQKLYKIKLSYADLNLFDDV